MARRNPQATTDGVMYRRDHGYDYYVLDQTDKLTPVESTDRQTFLNTPGPTQTALYMGLVVQIRTF